MNNLLKGSLAGFGAMNFGGCFGTIIYFAIIF